MSLTFETNWKRFAQGPREERVTGCELKITAGQSVLTSHVDRETGGEGTAPLLSAYPLAEWFAWNWWRLRWEPRFKHSLQDPAWRAVHSTRAAGGGYAWPDISFASDGKQVLVYSKETPEIPAEPIRYNYKSNFIGPLGANSFEEIIFDFIDDTIKKLKDDRIDHTDLHDIYADLCEELNDSNASQYRRFEAMLGYNPDDAPEALVSRLIAESHSFGEETIQELAALGAANQTVPDIDELKDIAKRKGFSGNADNVVRPLDTNDLPSFGTSPASARGVKAAQELRKREHLGDGPITDAKLAEMFGTQASALEPDSDRCDHRLAFALRGETAETRIVQRSKGKEGRRFDVARMIGDRVAVESDAQLRTAIQDVSTYRQQLQKAFAAEFLAPIDAVTAFIRPNPEDEKKQKEAAQHFDVSPMAINSILKNNKKIPRSDEDALDYPEQAA